jgi:hypothetical protein
MPTDWMGIGLSLIIVLAIIAIVIAKIQGDRVVDVMEQFLEFVKGGGK